MSGERILVVDDEPQIRRALRLGLGERGYSVELAATGEEGLDLAAAREPDAVLLDLMLPDMSGLDVCRELRQWTQAPVIVLSAKGTEQDKVQALDMGADDYVTKPFGLEELLARLRAVLRRADGETPPPILVCDELRLDQTQRLVTLADEQIRLTPTEYEMLRYLMLNAGKVITHRTLLHTIWGPEYAEADATLRVFIAQLRRKIERDPTRRFIQTETGVGYRFRATA